MKQVIELQEYLMCALGQLRISMKLSGVVGFLGVVMVNVFDAVHKWLDVNFDYVSIALFLVSVNHLLGSAVHKWILKDWDWQKNKVGILINICVVIIGGLVFEALTHITKEQDFVYSYLKMTTRLIVCIHPGLNIMKNLHILTTGKFPPKAIMDLFGGFQKDLSWNRFKSKKEEE
ncbi:hypothetical protein HX049_08025 [Myroides odoratimimus]|uniref:hypothetical protein n=1 Tax=Myroides odoratimimus TaxID=76832 RepID=UPI002576B27C|nr:hypothetical protein [Myroides odoratimimus]MDM1397121.1 hypothetical protein [Myroides odoratimimus]